MNALDRSAAQAARECDGLPEPASHTPGPRIVKRFDDAQIVVLGAENNNGRRDLVGTFTGPRREANARLDAAAADLLEMLRTIHDTIDDHDAWWMDCPDRGGFDLDRIKAIIAQATPD